MSEVIILLAAVLLAVAAVTMTLPDAITHHYEQNRDHLLSPM